VWQDVRAQLHPRGVEIVTVGMDTAGPEACRPFIEAANPQHPSLIDVGHVMAERFGVVNIPNGVWIDEDGMIVRPAEPAWPLGMPAAPRAASDAPIPEHMREIFVEASKISVDREAYGRALLDWVERGAASQFALSPDEVVARSTRRDLSSSEAAAHFALAQHQWRAGRSDAAIPHFREAHRLQPENFSYKRQAWSLATPDAGPYERYWQGPVEGHEAEWPYEGDWLSEVREMGAETYYPPMKT
jgi:hypothetical protein